MQTLFNFLTVLTFSLPYRRTHISLLVPDTNIAVEKIEWRVLLLNLGFLGDSIHLLPALWTLRQAYPQAELHVMVAEHVTRVMEVAPWVDKVWGYPRYPKGPKWYQDLGRIKHLRDANFDVVINLNGSDRSSILTGLSGARWRLGRVPQDGGPSFWPLMFTHIVEFPYHSALISTQRWECLKQSGFPGEKPEFTIEIPASSMASMTEKAGGDGGWIHVSPFTTVNYRELSVQQMTELLGSINRRYPELKIVLTCAPNKREQKKNGHIGQSIGIPAMEGLLGRA